MDIVNKKCPICGSPTYQNVTCHTGKMIVDEVNCYRCGHYIIDRTGSMELNYLRDPNHFNNILISKISGWIRENQGSDIIEINRERLQSLISLPELNVFEKADKMLLYLAKKFPVAGMKLNFKFGEAFGILEKIRLNKIPTEKNIEFLQNAKVLLPLVAIGRIIDEFEFDFIFQGYLRNEQKYISENNKNITSRGWAYLETFRHPNPDSKKVFVAIWFTDEMKDILLKYIKPAAKEAGGYNAEPIDEKDYNGDINDAIIGEIRGSKFVIADFTGNRGGVYFEAGFAYGLNIPVIYSCKKELFNKFVKQNIKTKDSKGNEKEINKNVYSQIHFDVNHQNFILWKDGKDLHDKLVKRIKSLPLTR